MYIFISDLHIGGLTDYRALEYTVYRIKQLLTTLKPNRRVLVILGDIVEGSNIHKYQQLVTHPTQQVKYAAYVIKWIVDELAVNKVIIIPGNHDLRSHEGKDLFSVVTEQLRKLGVSVEPKREGDIIKIGNKKVLLRHEIGYSSGGYAAGLTPKLLTNALIYLRQTGADVVVVGHYHVFAITSEVILLPSFQWSSDPKYWYRGSVVITDDWTVIPVITRNMTNYNSPTAIDELEEWLHSIKSKYKKPTSSVIRLCREFDGYRRTRIVSAMLYNKIKTMIEAGVPLNAIARELGVDRSLVRFVKYGHPC